jgi:predicted AlkP superfamily phosphohydrolase/phosphomutase
MGLTYKICVFISVLFFIQSVFYGCTMNEQDIPEGLTILGLDGATWEVIDLLIAKGELPGFRQLKEKGAWGYLETHVPTDSVSIWTTIATGVSPSRHGIQSFTRRLPGTDQFVPSPGTDRLTPALWNMVSDNDRRVVSVKWFASWPAEKVNGAMLSPRLEADDSEPRTYPIELFHKIDHFRYESIMDDLPQPPPRNHRQLSNFRQNDSLKSTSDTVNPRSPPMLIGQSEVKTTMFDDTSVWLAGKYVFDMYQPDLFMLYMKSTDRVQHFLWGAHEEENADPFQKAEAEAIYGWYRYYDEIILTLLEDESRVLMVISDHGFQSQEDVSEHYSVHDIDFDLILHHAGFLVKNGLETDWSRTKLYTYRVLPFDQQIVYRLNLKNREPKGVVDSDHAETALTDMVAILSSIRTSGGHVLFHDVQADLNDFEIICTTSDSISMDDSIVVNESVIKLRDSVIQTGLPRGVHVDGPPGIFAASGPGINQNLMIHDASVFDITPTALHILGLPVARDFDGKVLSDIFDSTHYGHIQYIPSYGLRETADELTMTEGDDRMLDELRALGYIQ